MVDQLGTSPDEVQFRFRHDEQVDHGTVTVDSFLDQSNATAVRIEPGDDARALLPHLDRVVSADADGDRPRFRSRGRRPRGIDSRPGAGLLAGPGVPEGTECRREGTGTVQEQRHGNSHQDGPSR